MTLWCSANTVNRITLAIASRIASSDGGAGVRSRQPYTTANESSDNRNSSAPLQRKSCVTLAIIGTNLKPPRVAITGIGVVSAFGAGREAYWDAIRCGRSGTRAITEFDASTYPCRVAAPVPPVDMSSAMAVEGEPGPRETRADPKRYSRAALFGVLAAREAWNDAGLSFAEPNAGVIIGSGGGGIDVGERQYQDFFQNNGQQVSPYAIAVGICGMVSSEISIALGLRGISHVLSTGCTSSTDALGYASMLLRQGEFDVLLSGGTDGCVLPGMIFGFSRMRAVSTHFNDCPAEASRPFDRCRDGFVLGEGSWMMALELEDRARARGADDLRDHRRLRLDVRRVSPRPDGSRRRADREVHAGRRRQVGAVAGGNRLHQLSRHVDTAERRRSNRDARAWRSASSPSAFQGRRRSR